MLTASFGEAFFGRPMALAGRIKRSPSRISAFWNHSRSRWGASSGSTHLLAIVLFFIGMTVPHGNDAPSAALARSPHYDDKPPVQPSCGDEARLAIIPTLVRQGRAAPHKNQFGVCKVQASLGDSYLTLRLVPAIHKLMYIQEPVAQGRRAVWLKRTRRSASVGGAERRTSLPRSTPLCTAGRRLTASRQRATLGNSSSGWRSGLAINTQGQLAISAIE